MQIQSLGTGRGHILGTQIAWEEEQQILACFIFCSTNIMLRVVVGKRFFFV